MIRLVTVCSDGNMQLCWQHILWLFMETGKTLFFVREIAVVNSRELL
jgi:hypothetical protein